jgi:hypothetical protein
MDYVSELRVSLNGSFVWNKARITCFVKMMLALISTRTVNLNKIACAMSSNADHSSRYRRVQRFFAEFAIDFDLIAGFIFKLFFASGGKWYLTLDRTNWQWGKSDITRSSSFFIFPIEKRHANLSVLSCVAGCLSKNHWISRRNLLSQSISA